MKLIYSRRLWFTVSAILIATIAILIYQYFHSLVKNWFDVFKYGFGIAGLISTLYNYWSKFNIFINRVKIILLNSSSKWNVHTEFEGDFNSNIQQKIKEKMLENKNSGSFNLINDRAFSLNIDGLRFVFDYIDIYDEETDVKGKVVCRVDDFYCSYDKSLDIFQNRLTPIFRSIERELKPDSSKFTFKISFQGKNPFISMIAKNIDSKKVHRLWYSYSQETIQGKKNITISEKALECTTNDITEFQTASVNFISLVGD
ncbi:MULTISPECIES: hypothetical protein [Peribacillus]|uniref:hypothetical protein n=1 Tax=Peribacillus TaxID=2675229 RepID=UPI001F4D7A5B|nr:MULTISPECIES: hypothetical protein [unclassified Peribacillus]MCK1986251.1 hypothetical protein [Peribacillus sp. Aquil_B1]MCK2010392.1 hypothetical protein [Peribacillus sp. Aquil_B8]